MSTAVYFLGTREEDEIFAFDEGLTVGDIRYRLLQAIENNGYAVQYAKFTTTEGDYFAGRLEEVIEEVIEFSTEMNG